MIIFCHEKGQWNNGGAVHVRSPQSSGRRLSIADILSDRRSSNEDVQSFSKTVSCPHGQGVILRTFIRLYSKSKLELNSKKVELE